MDVYLQCCRGIYEHGTVENDCRHNTVNVVTMILKLDLYSVTISIVTMYLFLPTKKQQRPKCFTAEIKVLKQSPKMSEQFPRITKAIHQLSGRSTQSQVMTPILQIMEMGPTRMALPDKRWLLRQQNYAYENKQNNLKLFHNETEITTERILNWRKVEKIMFPWQRKCVDFCFVLVLTIHPSPFTLNYFKDNSLLAFWLIRVQIRLICKIKSFLQLETLLPIWIETKLHYGNGTSTHIWPTYQSQYDWLCWWPNPHHSQINATN